MAQPVGGDGFSKTVVLLKKEDCERRNGKVYMPNTIEMAKIRKPDRGQYRTNVQFSKIMGKDMVRRRLQEEFPTFDLMNVRFSCAAVSQDSIAFQFHGTPCVWDGRTIKRLIKGNSVLYIVMEYDQMNTTSGISASDPESSQDAAKMSPLLLWLKDNIHFDVECNPNYSPLQGGGPCVFTFTPRLQPEVTSVYATFEELGTQKLEYLKLGFLPASRQPQVVRVTLTSQDGIILGYTQVTYGTNLQQVVSYPSALKKLFEDLMSCDPSDNPSGNSGGEAESLITLGCKTPAQMLSLLVYVAAEIGAQQFIEIIFTSSARRVVHNAYKCNLTLPETIARDHGYIETANYLADVTKRFSEETSADKECSQAIDWSELVKAAEVAEKQLDLTKEKQNGEIETNDPKETGYLADADTSSSEASASQSSDSEDDILNNTKTTAAAATAKAKAAAITTAAETRKGSVSGRECQIGLQKDLHSEDGNADTVEPIAGNYKSRKETLHQFESKSEKKGETWQQGDLHRRDRKTDSKDSIAGIVFYCVLFIGAGFGYMMEWFKILINIIGGWWSFLLSGGVTSTILLGIILLAISPYAIFLLPIILLAKVLMAINKLLLALDFKSDRKGEIWQQGYLHRKNPNRDTGNPIASNYLDRKDIFHQLESKSGGKGEIWQEGDLHRKDPNRDTGNPIASNYLDRKDIFPQVFAMCFEEVFTTESGIVFYCVLFIGAGVGCMMVLFPILRDIRVTTIILLSITILTIINLARNILAIFELPYPVWNKEMERTTEDFQSS